MLMEMRTARCFPKFSQVLANRPKLYNTMKSLMHQIFYMEDVDMNNELNKECLLVLIKNGIISVRNHCEFVCPASREFYKYDYYEYFLHLKRPTTPPLDETMSGLIVRLIRMFDGKGLKNTISRGKNKLILEK